MAERKTVPDLQQIAARNLLKTTALGRLYENLETEDGTLDLLWVDKELVGYMVADDPKKMAQYLAKVPAYDELCNAVFVVHRNLNSKQLGYFPAGWGLINGNMNNHSAGGTTFSRGADVRPLHDIRQLVLLTDPELRDLESRTHGKKEPAAPEDRAGLLKVLDRRFSRGEVTDPVAEYLLRRGTELDHANPEPEPAFRNTFSYGFLKDKSAAAALGFAPPPSYRRKTPSPGMLLLDRPLTLAPNAHFRITREILDILRESEPLIADMAEETSETLNAFYATHVLPGVPAVQEKPYVPEEYHRRREILQELKSAVSYYLKHSTYTRTWMTLRSLDARLEVLLRRPDPQVGPDTVEHTVRFDEITARPGAPWMSEQLLVDFLEYLAYGGPYYWTREKPGESLAYVASTGSWTIYDRTTPYENSGSIERLESEFGVPDYNGLRVYESLLNMQQPKFADEDKTAAVMERQERVLEEFRQWLARDPWRRWQIEEDYNTFFGKYAPAQYDGSSLEFPALSPDVELYPYQRDAVAQIIAEKNTLLAFDVGAGKTYIMAAAAMNMRASGKSRKNLFVVPNNIVGQWERIFHTMYPQARLKIVEPKTFVPSKRQEVLKDIRDNDYDGIIMAYSSFELIRLSKKEIRRQRSEQSEEIADDLDFLGPYDSAAVKPRQYLRAIEKEADTVLKSVGGEKGELTLDKLGITMLFLDEAHNFKNVPIRSALKNVAGINLKGSRKNLNMLYRVRAIQRDGGVVFATGTPLSNSLADCYTMQRYLQPEMMHETHLEVFDNWIRCFARPEYVCEIDVDTSKFRYVNRLARFHNLPELSRLFAGNAAFYALDEKALPELRGYTNVLIPEDPQLSAYMQQLCKRTEIIRAGKIAPFLDNMLKITTDGRKAALDMRLVGGEQPYTKSSKVYRCVKEVLKVYKENPEYTQIVFCDYSVPKANEFNVYEDLRLHFIQEGVPQQEIAFIHSATTEAKKLQLYEKVNAGEIRILIGSTFKLGIGANVQTHLKAIHHLDIPWRPADMVQREGRILRKGNENDEVRIYRYITEGSFDAYSWQILETKQKFISEFLTGSTYQRSASDLEDNVLTFGQVKALAISEPLMKDLAEKQNELRRIRLLAQNFRQTQDTRRGGMDKLRSEEQHLRKFAEITQTNADYAETLEDKQYKEFFKAISQIITDEVLTGAAPFPEELRTIADFTVSLPPAEERENTKPALILSRGGADYTVRMGDKPRGNARRLINYIKAFPDHAEKAEQRAEAALSRIQGNEIVLEEANPYPARIKELRAEIDALQNQIVSRQYDRANDALQLV